VRTNDVVRLGTITLVAQKAVDGRAVNIGLQLDEPDPVAVLPQTLLAKLRRQLRRARALLRRS
jgi:hypothetical protein